GLDLTSLLQAVNRQGELHNRGALRGETRRENSAGISLSAVQPDHLMPPGVGHLATKLVRQAGLPDVHRGQIFLKGEVSEAVYSRFSFQQQAAAIFSLFEKVCFGRS